MPLARGRCAGATTLRMLYLLSERGNQILLLPPINRPGSLNSRLPVLVGRHFVQKHPRHNRKLSLRLTNRIRKVCRNL